MLIGRACKAPVEVYRYTADFSEWLDPDETITAMTAPVVTLQPTSWPGPWPASAQPPNPDIIPPDPTPVVVDSTFILPSGVYTQVFLSGGTDTNTYRITYVATGTSGRTKEVQLDLAVRENSVRVV